MGQNTETVVHNEKIQCLKNFLNNNSTYIRKYHSSFKFSRLNT